MSTVAGSALGRVMLRVEELELTVAPWSRDDDLMVECPLHRDQTPSLHVTDKGEGGLALVVLQL